MADDLQTTDIWVAVSKPFQPFRFTVHTIGPFLVSDIQNFGSRHFENGFYGESNIYQPSETGRIGSTRKKWVSKEAIRFNTESGDVWGPLLRSKENQEYKIAFKNTVEFKHDEDLERFRFLKIWVTSPSPRATVYVSRQGLLPSGNPYSIIHVAMRLTGKNPGKIIDYYGRDVQEWIREHTRIEYGGGFVSPYDWFWQGPESDIRAYEKTKPNKQDEILGAIELDAIAEEDMLAAMEKIGIGDTFFPIRVERAERDFPMLEPSKMKSAASRPYEMVGLSGQKVLVSPSKGSEYDCF